MVETIIKDYEGFGFGTQNGAAKLTLKVNSELKKLGFKKMVMGRDYIGINDIEKDLTIHFFPYFKTDINCQTRNSDRMSFVKFRNHLGALYGYDSYWDYYSLRNNTFEKQITLKYEFDGKGYEIGHYLPSRNIVLIYLPIKCNWDKGLDNKYVLEILKIVKEVVNEYKIKAVDTSNAMEEIMLNKFSKATKSKITNIMDDIIDDESNIETYEPKLARWSSNIRQNKEIVRVLEVFISQMKEGLSAKIEEVKGFKFVKDVKLTDDGIQIKFSEVFIKFNGNNIRMGNYTATLLPENIKIVNDKPIERNGDTYHHPHISDRTTCFGDSRSLAYKMLGELNLKKLTHFLWLYLNGFNAADTFIPMRDWVAGRNNNDVVPSGSEDRLYCEECASHVDDDDYNHSEDMCNNCWEDGN